MNIMPKQEVCDNVPISIPMLSFDSLIADMKKMKSISKEKLLALQRRLEAAGNEAKMLREENEILKSSLQAKERECKFYYNQNQNKASSLVDKKAKATTTSQTVNEPELDENQGHILVFDDPDLTDAHKVLVCFNRQSQHLQLKRKNVQLLKPENDLGRKSAVGFQQGISRKQQNQLIFSVTFALIRVSY